jgi:broad specificity phosphatase PhoE
MEQVRPDRLSLPAIDIACTERLVPCGAPFQPERRRLLGALALLLPTSGMAQTKPSVPAGGTDRAFETLRRGGVAVLMRHAATVAGTGDPPGFRLDDCATQRNLSERGRADARALGERFRRAGIRFDRVLTSQWCRCRETAQLVAGRAEDWPAVNSFFEDRATEPRQTAEARERLLTIAPNETWLVVTHQVNISALVGEFTAMGESVVVQPRREGATARLEVVGRIAVA